MRRMDCRCRIERSAVPLFDLKRSWPSEFFEVSTSIKRSGCHLKTREVIILRFGLRLRNSESFPVKKKLKAIERVSRREGLTNGGRLLPPHLHAMQAPKTPVHRLCCEATQCLPLSKYYRSHAVNAAESTHDEL
ncbi:unnamed protein product [Leptosia nina]|uniref:Uncharacterized protein n=1 Tax=Leptosia nina TaxID=320188 RepID=A0AAV1J5Q6_9NEOP